jgi:hypothetical protein
MTSRRREEDPARPEAYLGSSSTLSAASRCRVPRTWLYVSSVMLTVEWPRRSWVLFGCSTIGSRGDFRARLDLGMV